MNTLQVDINIVCSNPLCTGLAQATCFVCEEVLCAGCFASGDGLCFNCLAISDIPVGLEDNDIWDLDWII